MPNRSKTLTAVQVISFGATLLPVFCGQALAQSYQAAVDKFHITDAEKAACQQDAITLCSTAYPNEERLLSCMKQNRPQLTPTCLVTFDAGLKRRHLAP